MFVRIELMTKKSKEVSQDVGGALNRWDVGNVLEMEKFTIKKTDGKVVEMKEVDEYKDNVKTGGKVTIYLFQLEYEGNVKEAKFGKQSMQACIKAWGTNAINWAGKHCAPTFAAVGNNQYIIWKPLGKIAGA